MDRLKKTVLSLSGLLLVLAAFFRFALRGYSFLALALAGAAAALALLCLLPKRGRRALLALMLAFACVFGVFEAKVLAAAEADPPDDADYLIVLGCGVFGTSPSPSLRERLEAAEGFLKEHPDCVAVVSGGQGQREDISEAECMRRWLTARGIEPGRIILEDKALSTEENMTFSAPMIEAHSGKPLAESRVAVCSSEYHLYRARWLARRFIGIDPPTVAAETERPLLRLSNLLREGCGMMITVLVR